MSPPTKFIQRNGQRFFNTLIPVVEYRDRRKIDRTIERPIYSQVPVHSYGKSFLIEDSKYQARTICLIKEG